jgi:hypothetical protein
MFGPDAANAARRDRALRCQTGDPVRQQVAVPLATIRGFQQQRLGIAAQVAANLAGATRRLQTYWCRRRDWSVVA